ncbi:hypothetical protein BDF14DRAFT_1800049, partial [Spinellus fusiger]
MNVHYHPFQQQHAVLPRPQEYHQIPPCLLPNPSLWPILLAEGDAAYTYTYTYTYIYTYIMYCLWSILNGKEKYIYKTFSVVTSAAVLLCFFSIDPI